MGGPTSRIVFALAIISALFACDSRAKASDPEGGRADSKSKEYESCGASVDCAEGLRCFQQMCRRTARSTVGDYFAALGNQLRVQGLADLAMLGEAGLDPLALGRTQLADVYLTRAPQKPATDKLQVTVTATPSVDKKSYQLIP